MIFPTSKFQQLTTSLFKELNKRKWQYLEKAISTLVIASLIAPMILMIPASPFANQKADN